MPAGKGGLYRHFSSKEELAEEAFRYSLARLTEARQEGMEQIEQTLALRDRRQVGPGHGRCLERVRIRPDILVIPGIDALHEDGACAQIGQAVFGVRQRDFPEILPWDFIKSDTAKERLWEEYTSVSKDTAQK